MSKLNGSAKAAVIGAVFSAVAAVGCIIYGAVYSQYADYAVVIALILGALLLACYAFVSAPICSWANILGVFATGFGLGLFICNSYNVWADTNGNLQQYGSLTGEFNFFNSQGGPYLPAILIIIGLLAAVFGIVSCFSERGNKK